jgi:hypothetical protein
MPAEAVYQMVFGELNNLSPCPLPLHGKGGERKERLRPSPLKERGIKGVR